MLFEHANDAICITTPKGRILSVNFRACEMLGYSRDDFLGKYFTDFIVPEEHARLLVGLAKLNLLDLCSHGLIAPSNRGKLGKTDGVRCPQRSFSEAS
jgi:PAS domain S-box-containing protein